MTLKNLKLTELLFTALMLLSVSLSFLFASTARAEEKLPKAAIPFNWFQFSVKKVDFLKNMYIDEVQNLFVRRNAETYVPAIQHFSRPITKDFETDFKHITREVLAKISDTKGLPAFVKPLQDRTTTIQLKGQKVKSHYLEYEYQGTQFTKVTCFTAIQTGNSIQTFFTQSRKGSFNDCQKEMRDVVNYI